MTRLSELMRGEPRRGLLSLPSWLENEYERSEALVTTIAAGFDRNPSGYVQ